jgi:hypothetical protein
MKRLVVVAVCLALVSGCVDVGITVPCTPVPNHPDLCKVPTP